MKHIITYISLILLVSCSTSSKEKKYQDIFTLSASDDSIKIRLKVHSRNLSDIIQYFEYGDTIYLAVQNSHNNSIDFYNLTTQKFTKELKILVKGNNAFGGLNSFLVINFDTIFIISNSQKKIGVVDSTGRILKIIRFEKDIKNRNTITDLPVGGQRPLLISKKIYLGQVYAARESNGKLTETGQKNSFVNLTVDTESEVIISSPLTYPKELIGKDVYIMSVQRILGYNKSFVYHFGYINRLFVTDNHIEFISKPIEINYDLKISQKGKHDLMKSLNEKLVHDEIINIYYDQYRDCYYLFIRKRESKFIRNSSISTHFIYPDCFILILDKNLNYLGEVFFPKNTLSFNMAFITPKGLYVSEDNIYNPNFSDDYMRFRLFTLDHI